MKRNVLFAGILALAGVFFFQGISMAGLCKQLGLSSGCVRTTDVKKSAVNNGRIRANTIKLSKMDDSVAGVNGNGMIKAWARIDSDGTVASCWRCNTDPAETNRISAGTYEVDFTPLSTDITSRPRTASLTDLYNGGAVAGFISTADRGGDDSSIYVRTYNTAGAGTDRQFTLIIY